MSTSSSRRRTELFRLFFGAPPGLKGSDARSASILAVLTICILIINVIELIFGGTSGILLGFGFANFALVFVCYVLSRTQLYRVGAWLFVFGILAEIFLVILVMQPQQLTPALIIFLLFPGLLSTLLLRSTVTAWVAVATVVGFIVSGTLAPWLALSMMLPIVLLISSILVLLVATAYLRERDVQTVEMQTRQIESYRTQLEQEISGRTQDMSAAAEIGRAITSVREEDELLEEVIRLIITNFEYYLAQIYLMDESQQYIILHQTSDPANTSASLAQISVGDASLVGQVAQTGVVSTINDTESESQYAMNYLPPKTRSEVALPLRTGEHILGVLDLHSASPQALTQADIPIFQTIADQLAIALENVELFARAQRDLADIELLNRQLTGEAWSKFLTGRSKPVGYQTGTDENIEPLVGTGMLAPPDPKPETVRIPLQIRGETIGILDISPKEAQEPDEETKEVLQAVAERVALALDSTRLSEQAQRQAEQEQLLSQLSAELQAATDMNSILKIAAEQASQSLDAPSGFAHLKLTYDLSLDE